MKFGFILMLCLLSANSYCQHRHGRVTYTGEITKLYDSLGNEVNLEEFSVNNSGIIAICTFDEEHSKFEFGISIMYSQTITVDHTEGHLLFLENDFGEYYADALLMDEFLDQTNLFNDLSEDLNYLEDTTKVILGYKCSALQYTEFDETYTVWYTQEIDPGLVIYPVPTDLEKPFLSLEFYVALDGIEVKFTATEIDFTAPQADAFEMKLPYGYEIENPIFHVEQPYQSPKQLNENRLEDRPPPPKVSDY